MSTTPVQIPTNITKACHALHDECIKSYALIVETAEGHKLIRCSDNVGMYPGIFQELQAIVNRGKESAAAAEQKHKAWYAKTFTHNHTDQELLLRKRKALLALAAPDSLAHEALEAEQTFTCDDCKDKRKCPFAFDAYNISGDCLAIK